MTDVRHKTVTWRSGSLRGRVTLLACTVVVLLTATLLILVWVLRTSQSDLVARSNIAATNRTLASEVEKGRFRADLYYRLNAFHLPLPPLRERRYDISLLCEYFLERYAALNHTSPSILDSNAKASLESHDYPGNVRELEQLINKLAVQAGGRAISGLDVDAVLRSSSSRPESDFRRWEELPFREAVATFERHLIERALRLAGGNKSDAARKLGIQRRLLYEKLQQLSGGQL